MNAISLLSTFLVLDMGTAIVDTGLINISYLIFGFLYLFQIVFYLVRVLFLVRIP